MAVECGAGRVCLPAVGCVLNGTAGANDIPVAGPLDRTVTVDLSAGPASASDSAEAVAQAPQPPAEFRPHSLPLLTKQPYDGVSCPPSARTLRALLTGRLRMKAGTRRSGSSHLRMIVRERQRL